jgi:hypothetical protein
MSYQITWKNVEHTFHGVLDANPMVHYALCTRVAVVVQAGRMLPHDANLLLQLRRVIDKHNLRVW